MIYSLINLYKNINLLFVSPKDYQIEDDLRKFLSSCPSLTFAETDNFLEAVNQSDGIYMTRLQDEYDVANESKNYKIEDYSLTYDHLNGLKQDCIIMHPMPRKQELDPKIDFDKRAVYWKQEKNGMWIRAALIIKIFERYQEIVSL